MIAYDDRPDWGEPLEPYSEAFVGLMLIEHPPYDAVPLIVARQVRALADKWRSQGVSGAVADRQAHHWGRHVMRVLAMRGSWAKERWMH